MKQYMVLLICILSLNASAQRLKKIAKLSPSLKEISGLTFLNDSILVAHNDSGADAILYFLSTKGNLMHQLSISNAENIDWEAITSDNKGFLYVGDFGNNNNQRKDLKIYKIPTANILTKSTITAEIISFRYAEQIAFPPESNALHFDAEAMTFHNDSLHIFTKCRAKPFDGNSFHYVVPAASGNYVLSKKEDIFIGRKGFFLDAVTDAAIEGENCYLLTYNKCIAYKILNGQLKYIRRKKFFRYTQKEAITADQNGILYIADEKQKMIGGGNLYQIQWK